MIKYKMRRKGIVYGEYFNCGRQKNMQDIIAEYMRKGGHTCFTADDSIDALMI